MSEDATEEPTAVAAGAKPVKLPYFHRTLSEEDVALIGDIAPKRISVGATGTEEGTEEDRKLSSSSKWNAAGTWEERNCTQWSKDTIRFKMSGINVSQDGYEVTIEKCDDIIGHANIATVRGKPKFLFEFEVHLKFEVTNKITDSTLFKGNLILSDIQNDQIDDTEFRVDWKSSSPSGAEAKILRTLLTEGELKAVILCRLKAYEEEYRQL
jgi:hypothetical protein